MKKEEKSNKAIKLFENRKIRVKWLEDEEKWYFSIVDVIAVLTESENPNNYWKVLKHRLKEEGSKSVTNCNQLKLKSSDGKFYKTDVGDTKTILRLIQSIPSKKAEPFLSFPSCFSFPSSSLGTHRDKDKYKLFSKSFEIVSSVS